MQDLLLLHGAIGAKGQLEKLAIGLRKNYRIHKIDFNGHGNEAPAGFSFSIEGFAHDVIKFLNENNITQTSIFGYSMGGYVAMWLAKYYSQNVNKVITLATKFHWDEHIAEKEIKMLNATTIEEKIPAFARELHCRHLANDWKHVLEKTRKMLIQLGDRNPLLEADFRVIDKPCLLLIGDKDKMAGVEETVAVCNELPNGTYRILSDTSHPIEQVNVPMLAGIIEDFLGL